MNTTDLPKTFWHVAVKLSGQKRRAIVNDLDLEVLQRTIIKPWRAGLPFMVAGAMVTPDSKPEEIRIVQTDQPQQHFADRHADRTRKNGIADFATDRRYLPFSAGRDHSFDLLMAGTEPTETLPDIRLILEVCRRLPRVAQVFGARSRAGRTPFLVEDEYDVQDLLHGTLRGILRYSVQEYPLPKVAGCRSGRADISIEELGVLIELKFARGPRDQKRIFDEFSQDLVLYSRWPHLKTLIFLVYNSQDLRDPEALTKLSGLHTISDVTFNVEIALA